MGSSRLGLHPLDARSKAPPKLWNPQACRHCQNPLRGQNGPNREGLPSVMQDPKAALGDPEISRQRLLQFPSCWPTGSPRYSYVCKQRASFAFPTILGAEVNQLLENTRPVSGQLGSTVSVSLMPRHGSMFGDLSVPTGPLSSLKASLCPFL